MMEFILSKVARISWSRTLFQVNIKSFTFILRAQIKILKKF